MAQDPLLAVARDIGDSGYDPARSSFKNWLKTIRRHRTMDFIRRCPARRNLVPPPVFA